MTEHKKDTITTQLLLSLLNVIAGVALWFGYAFATHVTTQLDLHEARLDKCEIALGTK
jgi:hypothetical protein